MSKLPDDENSDRKLSDLSQQDQQLFEKLGPFIWVQGKPIALIYEVGDEIYKRQGITLSVLHQLEKLGLILFEPNGFVKKRFGKHTRLFYDGRPTKIEFSEPMDNQLDLGQVLLTDLGKELAIICPVSGNRACYEYVINRWFKQGLVLSSIQLNIRSVD